MSTTYNLFISHSWAYNSTYDSLVNLLNNASYFNYKNYSVPKNDPIHNANNSAELYEAIKNQVRCSSCVLILAGVYSSYSKWIDKEIQIAKELHKPVIAIEPLGSEKTSLTVKNSANAIVKWNTDSIINAIRQHAI